MTQHCELSQIGRIGKVKEVGQNLMISVASDASYKKDGEWVNRANWIEHTVFGRRDKMKDWALDTLQSGDLVFIRSTPSQTRWERDGEKQYGYTMAVTELKLLDRQGGPQTAGRPLILTAEGLPLRHFAPRRSRRHFNGSARSGPPVACAWLAIWARSTLRRNDAALARSSGERGAIRFTAMALGRLTRFRGSRISWPSMSMMSPTRLPMRRRASGAT